MQRKWLERALVVLGASFLLMQLVPYGREHVNPPVVAEPAWSSPDVRALAVRACYDCHSNETKWPWYSHVAPVSWLVQRDVVEGRRAVNFSEWNRHQPEASESAETVAKGEMPPFLHRLMHSQARLSGPERERFIQGLRVTFGAGSEGEGLEED